MAKVELKGTILTVNKPENVGEKQTLKQQFILKIPAWRDEYGEIKGKDEEWQIAIMGDNVEKFKLLKEHQGKKAKCLVYLNGQKYVKQSDQTEGWIINATLGGISYAEEKPAAPAPAASGSGTGSTGDGW